MAQYGPPPYSKNLMYPSVKPKYLCFQFSNTHNILFLSIKNLLKSSSDYTAVLLTDNTSTQIQLSPFILQLISINFIS